MSANITLNITLSIPLDLVCAIRNTPTAGPGLEAYDQIASHAAKAAIDEVKSLPYDIKPVEPADERITLLVKMHTGATVLITDIDKNASTTELRRRLHVKTGLAMEKTRLLFRDRVLEDEDDDNLYHQLWEVSVCSWLGLGCGC